ncbi:MAG: NUDIX domain-containing protein [Pseudomonadota bacterium]
MTEATPKNYGESVLFALHHEGFVLCEWRNWLGFVMNSIPGGKIDPSDRASDDYRLTALFREINEELAIQPTQFRFIGNIWYRTEWLFHVYLVEAWSGEVPPKSFEHGRTLNWIHPTDLVDNHYMPVISKLIRETLM